MMGQQAQKESLFYYFRLEDQIPETHLLRLIDRSVDFSFVRDRLTRFYSLTGVDPVAFCLLTIVLTNPILRRSRATIPPVIRHARHRSQSS